jgi:hypothetical protein
VTDKFNLATEKHGFSRKKTRRMQDSRFKIQDSRFKIQDSRFKIQDSRFKIQDSRFKIQDSRYRIQDSRVFQLATLLDKRRFFAALRMTFLVPPSNGRIVTLNEVKGLLCVISEKLVILIRLFQLWAKMAEVEHASACFVNLIDNLTS